MPHGAILRKEVSREFPKMHSTRGRADATLFQVPCVQSLCSKFRCSTTAARNQHVPSYFLDDSLFMLESSSIQLG